MEWFKAGGFGMFLILAVGIFAVAVGARAAMAPTAKRLALLGPLPALIALLSLFTFGTDLWAVNVHLSNPAFLKEANIAAEQLPFIGVIGITEAGQAFTLGGILAAITAALRAIAAWRSAPAA